MRILAYDGTRWRLCFVAFGWVVLGVASLGLGNTEYPPASLAGFFSLVAACFALYIVRNPLSRMAFRIGGTFAVGTLFLRGVTLAQVVFERTEVGFWLAVSSAGTVLLLSTMYGHWWLTDVARWHETAIMRRTESATQPVEDPSDA